MNVVKERVINYTEMAHGTIEYANIFNKQLDGRKFKINDEVSVIVRPDSGYMIGFIKITEESTGNEVMFTYSNDVGGSIFETIKFKMPNDNVNISTKFVRMVT